MDDNRRIMSVGVPLSGAYNFSFLSNANFREYEIVLLSIDALVKEFDRDLATAYVELLVVETRSRFRLLNEWVRNGHILIALISSDPYVSNFGDNYQFTNEEVFSNIVFNVSSGDQIEYCGPPSHRRRFSRLVRQLAYGIVLSGSNLQPLFTCVMHCLVAPSGSEHIGSSAMDM
jgi:hypothetical protein